MTMTREQFDRMSEELEKNSELETVIRDIGNMKVVTYSLVMTGKRKSEFRLGL